MVIFAKSKPNNQNRFCSQLLQSADENIDAYFVADYRGFHHRSHVDQRHIAQRTPMDSDQDRIQDSPEQQRPRKYFWKHV